METNFPGGVYRGKFKKIVDKNCAPRGGHEEIHKIVDRN